MDGVQEEMLTALKAHMSEEGISQLEMARRVGVSQATICRMLSRACKRRSRGVTLLERYIAENESKLHKKEMPDEIAQAVSMVWDGSASHASALAGIIRSLNGLVPKLSQQINGGENRAD